MSDTPDVVEGYCKPLSAFPGENITFYVYATVACEVNL